MRKSCILLALLALVAGLPASAADSSEALDFAAIVAQPVPACGGDCYGSSSDTEASTKPCDQLTAAEKQALIDKACEGTSKAAARRNANDVCLDKDNSGNCLCANVTWGDPEGSTYDEGGVCKALCIVGLQGTCSIVAAAEPDATEL